MGAYQSVVPDAAIFEPILDKNPPPSSNKIANGTSPKKPEANGSYVNGNANGDVRQRNGVPNGKSDKDLEHYIQQSIYDENYEGDNKEEKVVYHIVWHMLIYWVVTHIAGFYGIYLIFTYAQWKTTLFALLLGYGAGTGITAGTHRLWSHRAYKANGPLKALLVLLNCVSASASIWSWCVVHRVHHKYSDTDADPVNMNRGFFFSHIGWTMITAHPKVCEKVKCIDFSDLEADPYVMFNRKYYTPLTIVLCYTIPTLIPVYYWNEDFLTSLLICGVLRHLCVLHGTFTINSVNHLWGLRPYNKEIQPTENFWANLYTAGEGYHNYHHTFPWDYRASEWSWKINATTIFIDFMAAIGWAYDLKRPSNEMIKNTKMKKGDHS